MQESLYSFKHPSQYDEEMVLKPRRKLNPELVVEEWDNIQRIIVSLALKTTTQHIIVGKLNAFARKNKTRRALWEYDNMIRSLYLLNYIDSPPLRQYVQRALNRGENYHQLRRAVSYTTWKVREPEINRLYTGMTISKIRGRRYPRARREATNWSNPSNASRMIARVFCPTVLFPRANANLSDVDTAGSTR